MILNVVPTYVTDALVRKINVDRYDDREVIKTNLIESYGQLLDFGRKNLPDKFFLEDTVNKSLRNIIVREMISNTLMHREFTSSYTAKFVIERERMYVENDDIFRIIVPLDNDYSFDYSTESGGHNKTKIKSADKVPVNNLSAQKKLIIQFVKEKGTITSRQAEELLKVKQRRARSILGEMVNMGVLERQGSYKSTVYVLKSER